MDPLTISSILEAVNLNEKCVANIYHHGSWVYGSNTPESDRDLIVVTRSSEQKPIKFHEDFDYFHEFELHRLWNQYDIVIYSIENFEKLLEKNYINSVQCLFLPDEFKIKEEINFQIIYLEKYYNPLRLKQVAVYELSRDLNLYFIRNQPDFAKHPQCSSKRIETSELRENYIFKNIFHGIRYLDFVEQLLEKKMIYDFKRVTHVFNMMKVIRENLSESTDLSSVIEFVRNKSLEYKPKFELLVSGNIVKGTFEVHITFSCTPRPQDLIDQLSKICQNTRYKFLFNEKWITSQQLIVSSNYEGECPAIIQQIENEVYEYFKDFDIIRIKIKSLTSNEGVPQYDLEKQFLWNDKTNYFELCYKFALNKNFKETIENLRRTCRTMFKNQSELKLPEIIFKHIFIENDEFILTIRLFEVGRTNALAKSNEIVKYFTTNNFPPSKVLSEFIVHDTNTTLDDD